MSAAVPTGRGIGSSSSIPGGYRGWLNVREPANPTPNASCVTAGAVNLGNGVGWASLTSSGLLGIKHSRKKKNYLAVLLLCV